VVVSRPIKICRQKNLSRFCLREAEQQNRGSSIAKLSGKSSPSSRTLRVHYGAYFLLPLQGEAGPAQIPSGLCGVNSRGLGGIFTSHFERSEIVAGPPAEPIVSFHNALHTERVVGRVGLILEIIRNRFTGDNERASAGLAVKFMEKSNAENNIEIFSKEVISANITILGYYHI